MREDGPIHHWTEADSEQEAHELETILIPITIKTIAHLKNELKKELQYHIHVQNKRNALSPQGPWEFTLTYTPKWYDSDEQAQDSMRSAINKLTKYYRNDIKEFHAVGERTKSNQSHVHGWYILNSANKISGKNFKRAYKHWNPKKKIGRGHVGGHHEPIKNQPNVS